MLQQLEELRGYRLDASDGHIGQVRDFLFDEARWGGRWLVADTGKWLLGKKVVISPMSLGEPNHEGKELPVRMTREEIEQAPHLDEHAPVSRRYEKSFFDQYDWPYYWIGGGLWGASTQPMYTHAEVPDVEDDLSLKEEGDPEQVLRSAHELTKYRVLAGEEAMGHIHDVLLDTEVWVVRYVVVDTRNWLPGKKVLLDPMWIREIRWGDHRVRVDLGRDEITSAPEYDPDVPITRAYESRLYDHFGKEGYW